MPKNFHDMTAEDISLHNKAFGWAPRFPGLSEAEKLARRAREAAEKAARDAAAAAEKAARDAAAAMEKARRDAANTAEEAAKSLDNVNKKAIRDTYEAIEKSYHDLRASHLGKEVGRGWRNTLEAGVAIGEYVKAQFNSGVASLSAAERRLREGKVLDAIWHLQTDQYTSTDENFAKAVQKSSLIKTIAGVAVSSAYGPAGSAAFAAWCTYHATEGNIELALKAGAIAGASAAAFGDVSKMDRGYQKVILAGALGGAAVAAAGGDQKAMEEAFLMSAGMVLIQDGYKSMTDKPLDGDALKPAQGQPFCMSTVGAECSPPDDVYIRDEQGNIEFTKDNPPKPMIDMKKIPAERPHVGKWATADSSAFYEETSGFMTTVSRVPGMNAMALFHDTWSLSWDMDELTNVTSIVPAVVLTYTGTTQPLYNDTDKLVAQERP